MFFSIVNKIFRSLGFQVSRVSEDKRKRNFRWLTNMKIKTVLDIGANEGQSIEVFSQLCPEAQIYSFEPLSDCYEKLISKYSEVDKVKAFNIALGNESGSLMFNRNNFSAASSIFEITVSAKKNYPSTSIKTTQEEVSIERLDDFSKHLNLESPTLIKIDVQGAEAQVIEGGREVFRSADVILIEMSLEYLYKEQPLFDEIYQMLKELGFKYKGNSVQSYSIHDGHIIFVDAIFAR